MKIKIRIKPNSSKEEVKKINEKEYIINLKEPAIDNKANIALIKLLQKYFKSPVRIKSGFTSRNKIVEVGESD